MRFFARGGLVPTAFFAFALGLSACSKPTGVPGVCGTEIEDPYQLTGCVEKDDGDIAVNVRVSAIPSRGGTAKSGSSASAGSGNAAAAVEYTDENGVYKFTGLEKGEYTLYFDYSDTTKPGSADADNAQAHRLDGAYALERGVNSLGETRLKPASALIVEPVVSMDTAAVAGAKCHIENTPYSGTSDGNGLLIFYALPGTYIVRCEKGNLKSKPYPVTLDSGRKTYERIPMSEDGQTFTIPAPANVVANLDTITGIVRVSWSKPASKELFQYRIRRVEIEKIDLLVGWDGVNDTLQFDPVFAGEPDTVTSKPVQYQVASKRGVEYSKPVSSSLFLVVRGPSARVDFLDTSKSTCAMGDTAKLIGTYKSHPNHNARVLWIARSAALDTLQDTKVDNRQGSDTLSYPCLTQGFNSLEFRVKDETGVTAITPFKFEITPSP